MYRYAGRGTILFGQGDSMFGFFGRRSGTTKEGGGGGADEPADPDDVRAIRGCRDRLGPRPRDLGPAEAEACRLVLNAQFESLLLRARDPLLRAVSDGPALLAGGRVVWGHLVQANRAAFDPANRRTLPANAVYSPDPYFDGRVGALASIARDLFSRKGSVPADRRLRAVVGAITDEHDRVLRHELPREFCGGREVYFTTCLLQPGHLPGGRLAQSAFPLLVNHAETPAVLVLPARFWPPDLVGRWAAAAPTDPPPLPPTPAAGVRYLTLTPAAAAAVRRVLREAGGQYLRVAWEVAEIRDGRPTAFQRSVSVEQGRRPDDVVVESEGVAVLIDSVSAKYFTGAGEVLDWVTAPDGRAGFKFRAAEDG